MNVESSKPCAGSSTSTCSDNPICFLPIEATVTDERLAEQIREIVRTELAPMRGQLDGLRAQLDRLSSDVAPMRAQLDGLPIINRTVTVIQQEGRALRAALMMSH
jgi:hypothetical protein